MSMILFVIKQKYSDVVRIIFLILAL